MLAFDPQDPFPLYSSMVPYRAEKDHAREVDQFLGLRVEEVERTLVDPRDGAKRWISQGPSIFQTPYTELRFILSQLEILDLERVVDLGAAYGRLGFVLHQHYPATEFLGYELVRERAEEGERALRAFGAKGRIFTQDLARADFKPPPASAYFLYDFGARAAVGKVLSDLRAGERPFVLVGRGREVRDQVEREHPWLQVKEPRHFPNFSLYRP
jgi:hypothetical protein